MADDEPTLIHFGVKGMRWGHRKSEDSSGSGTKGTNPVPDNSLTQREKELVEHTKALGLSDAQMRAKYAPEAPAAGGSKKSSTGDDQV